MRQLKVYKGYIFWVIAIGAFILGDVYLGLQIPYADRPFTYQEQLAQQLQPLFYGVIGLIYFYFISKVLFTRLRRVTYFAYLFAGFGLMIWTIQKGIAVNQVIGYHSYGEASQMIGIPLLIALLPPFLFYWREWLRESNRFNYFSSGGGASAKWATFRSFVKNPAKLKQQLFSSPNRKDEGVTTSLIFIGRSLLRFDPFPRLIGSKDDSHYFTIAPTRSGKSISVIYLQLMMLLRDFIIFDPKGELTKMTFERRASRDQLMQMNIDPDGVSKHLDYSECVIFDPFNITGYPSTSYAPMSEIDITADNAREIITAIADGCILPESEKNKWFEEQPKTMLEGLITYVSYIYRNHPNKKCLPTVLDLLNGVNSKGFADPRGLDNLLYDMLTVSAAGGLAQQAATMMLNMSSKDRGMLLTNLMRSLKWIGDPAIRKHLVPSDFRFSQVGAKYVTLPNGEKKKITQTVYFVLPDSRVESHKRWLRVMATVASVAMRRRNPLPKEPTIFLFDEFPLLGNLKTISTGFGLLAGYQVQFWCFAQNLSQLKNNYPNDWDQMLGNSNVQFFGQTLTDVDSLEYISKALGKHNIGPNGILDQKDLKAQDLLSPVEIVRLIGKSSNKQIFFPAKSAYPMLLERLAFIPLKLGARFKTLGMDGLRGNFKPSKKK